MVAKVSTARSAAEEALLDAAERVLVNAGYTGISTRRLAEEAGVNHGLVHYYFGSVENLLVRTLERFTERLITRQREMYAADMPFLEKWRTAMPAAWSAPCIRASPSVRWTSTAGRWTRRPPSG